MSRLRTMISLLLVLIGAGLFLTGVVVEPKSNPEYDVQIVVWGMVGGGIILMLLGALAVLRRKRP